MNLIIPIVQIAKKIFAFPVKWIIVNIKLFLMEDFFSI